MLQTLDQLAYQAKITFNMKPLRESCSSPEKSSHRQQNPQNGSFEGHLEFAACRRSAGETNGDTVRAAMEEQYSPTVPVPVHPAHENVLQFG